jgi:hypothetical protein
LAFLAARCVRCRDRRRWQRLRLRCRLSAGIDHHPVDVEADVCWRARAHASAPRAHPTAPRAHPTAPGSGLRWELHGLRRDVGTPRRCPGPAIQRVDDTSRQPDHTDGVTAAQVDADASMDHRVVRPVVDRRRVDHELAPADTEAGGSDPAERVAAVDLPPVWSTVSVSTCLQRGRLPTGGCSPLGLPHEDAGANGLQRGRRERQSPALVITRRLMRAQPD